MAEEIGYALVGEDKKLPNEVGYSINPEITKDASAVENANNQTTTGMAELVYGINAPKIRAKTSIVGSVSKFGELSGKGSFSTNTFSYYDNYTIVENQGEITLSAANPSRIYLTPGVYIIFVRINWMKTEVAEYIMRYGDDNIVVVDGSTDGNGYASFTAIYNVGSGGYIQLGVMSPSNNANAKCSIRFIKL